MQVTLINLFAQQTQNIVGKLNDQPAKNILVARMVVRIIKALKEHKDEFEKAIQMMNEREDVKTLLAEARIAEEKKDTAKLVEVNQKVDELFSEEMTKAPIELNLEKIPFDVLYEEGLTPREIMALEWLVADE